MGEGRAAIGRDDGIDGFERRLIIVTANGGAPRRTLNGRPVLMPHPAKTVGIVDLSRGSVCDPTPDAGAAARRLSEAPDVTRRGSDGVGGNKFLCPRSWPGHCERGKFGNVWALVQTPDRLD